MIRKQIICLAIVLASISIHSSNVFSDAEEKFHQTYPVASDASVDVENRNGKVYICMWDKDYVDVFALKRTKEDRDELDKITIQVNTNGVLRIRTVYPDKRDEEDSFFKRIFSWRNNSYPQVTVDYTIKLPRTVSLRRAEVRNGCLELHSTQGETTVYTRNGSIVLDDVDRCVEAETRNGEITIIRGTRIKTIRTRNGDIHAILSEMNDNNSSFTSRNGSVNLNVPPDINACIDLQTRNGNISTKKISLLLDTVSKQHVIGKLGAGGKTISVVTRNGNISMNY